MPDGAGAGIEVPAGSQVRRSRLNGGARWKGMAPAFVVVVALVGSMIGSVVGVAPAAGAAVRPASGRPSRRPSHGR